MKAPANLDRGRALMKQTSFIPEPELCVTLPEPSSRRAAILEALQSGERLNPINALKRGWGWRLAADVFALKEEHNWPIEVVMIHNDGGNPIAEYFLDGDTIAAVRKARLA